MTISGWTGTLKVSKDGGSTFTGTDTQTRLWDGEIAVSANGQKIIGGVWGSNLIESLDGGTSFQPVLSANVRGWGGVEMSADGSKIIAADFYMPKLSVDGGQTWIALVLPNQYASAKKVKLYIDDLDVGYIDYDSSPSFNATYAGLPFFIGSDAMAGDAVIGDMADQWAALGVSLIDTYGDIPVATRRKFIDANNKPVNPVNFPSGGQILLTGDSSTFSTNLLNGGSMTVTGTLTNSTTHP